MFRRALEPYFTETVWTVRAASVLRSRGDDALGYFTARPDPGRLATPCPSWLLTALALTIERLDRLRYPQLGGRPPQTAVRFRLALRLSLSAPLVFAGSERPASLLVRFRSARW